MIRVLSTVVVATVITPASAFSQDLAGCWVGTIAEGANRRRALIEVTHTDGTAR